MENTSIRTDSFRIIEDIQYTNTNLGAYNLYKADNYITLEINQEQIADCFLDSFSFSATIEVIGWDETGTSSTDTITLDIRYDQLVGGQYKAIHTKKYSGFYKLKFTVVSVSSAALTPYVRISGEIAIERYKDLAYTTTPTFSSASYNSTTGDITVTWGSITGAEEYDLEYTYIDDYLDTTPTYWATTALTPEFTRNATRVTVTGTSYSFSNVFEHGYVVFRVRAVGRTGANFTHVVNGKWSNEAYSPTLNNYPSSNYIAVTALNPTLNWQYVNTFSEQGKRKELISFMDGTFRSRQSITRISSDTTLIVSESVYDYQGRAAIEVIPIPIDERKITYQPDFTIHNTTGDNYTKLHFDTGWCLPLPGPVSKSYGAGKYYSTNNEFLAIGNHWLAEHNKYIPYDTGYVFTRAIYTPDNSGRIALQSGIGEEHRIGSGHETKYFYGTPYQEELDRLFGNHVGNALHYQKQMVLDPNGQVSVSYTDLSGNVIATALSGNTPANVSTLSNNLGSSELEVDLNSYSPGSYDPYARSVAKAINVAVPGEYRLNYILEIGEFEDNCLTDCYECVYDLEVSVKNDCGEEQLDGDLGTSGIQPFVRRVKRSAGAGFSLSCSSDTIYYKFIDDTLLDEDSIRVTLGVGSYIISKTLRVSNDAAEFYADEYIATAACVKTPADFEEYFQAIVDDFGCEVTCAECTAMLSDSSSYVTSRKSAYVNLGYTDNADLTQMVAVEYSAKKEICNQVCNAGISPCEFQRVMLTTDVAPGGQYEDMDGDITLHPEYCHYAHCIANTQAFRYEARMNNFDNSNDAIQAGWMDPLQNQSQFPNGEIDSFFMVGPGTSLKPALESKLAYAGVITLGGTHNLNIWELSIYSAYCNSGTTWSEVSSCISGFTYDPNVYQSRNAYAFQLFRAFYLKARKDILDSVKYASSSYCQGLTIPTGKTRRFLTNDQIEDQFPDNQAAMEAGALTRCENFCDSSSYAWLQILGPCVMEHEDIEDIRLALVDVCSRGCDGYNPMGAKTVTPGNISGSLPNSFREVLEDFGIYNANTCNDLALSGIKDHQTSLMNGPWKYSGGEDCMCEQAEDTSILSVSDPDLRIVLEQFSYLEEDTVCETCATCEQVFQAYYPFYLEHGTVPFEGDSLVSIWPDIFSDYMNTQLNFSLTYEDYHDFILECMGVDSSNDLFEDILVNYRTKYLWLIDLELSKGYEGMPNPDNLWEDRLWQRPLPELDYAFLASPETSMPELLAPLGSNNISACFCQKLFEFSEEILEDTVTYDPSDTNNVEVWENEDFFGCDHIDSMGMINKAKEVCRQAFSEFWGEGHTNSTMAIESWWDKPELQQHVLELASKNDVYFEQECFGFPACDFTSKQYFDSTIFDPDSLGVPFTGGKLTCQDIRDGVDEVMSTMSWSKITPSFSNYWRIAQYIDTTYDSAPYNRIGAWQDSTYRIERIISEISQCIIDDACYRAQYFDTCSSGHCAYKNENTWMMRNFVDDMVEPRQTGYVNYLSNSRWEHDVESFTTYSASDLYTGNSPGTLVNRFDTLRQYNSSGKPRIIAISDSAGHTVHMKIAFRGMSMQHYYGDITDVLAFRPIYFDPCDTTTLGFNILAIMKTGVAPGYDTLWLFGLTDTFDYLSNCDDQLTLCNTPTFVADANPCGIDLTAMATNMATYAYEIYLDSIRQAFIHAYKTQCIENTLGKEEFEVRFDQQEYHYTLYYYDLGGNIVQTVPPEGVNFLTLTQIGQSMDFRKGIGSAYFASHDIPTRYKYNTLNELNWQSTPDGGVSNFWYDMLGRLVVSQNAKQVAYSPDKYSYIEYDALGRIAEVGQIAQSTAMTFSIAYDATLLNNWIVAGDQEEITNTYYDEPEFSITYNDFSQNYLRNRVASSTYTTTEGATDYQSAVHYDYDVHGNVKAMVRETPGLDSIFEQYKVIRYEYELVSGNVLKVLYQQDSLDRFFHKYEYDADNGVIGAYTSRDQIHWDRDAKYTYYLHGPMARTELGELRVQGMDYAYTLHGWLKGINSERLRTSHDIGKDGNTGSTNQWVCEDVFGFGLGYYAGDYRAIGGINPATHFIINKAGSELQAQGKSLYNGNIGIMVTAISQFMEQGDIPFGRAFRYDQLNRIMSSRAYNNVDTGANNKWNTGSALTQYSTDYTYDANGNILTLLRKGKASQTNMDNLTYHYYSGTNRLEYVDDAISSSNYGIDIDDQAAGNYTYDAIGNLISDASEEIETINWTVYGKIQSIIRTSTSTKPDLEFEYSPDGYRSAKHVTDPTTGLVTSTWYVRDASGNIMATYEKRDFTTLDTTTISLAELNSLVIADWGDHVFAKFLNEAIQLHTMMDASQFTSLKLAMSGAMELDTMLKMNSPLQILINETTLADNTVSSYTAADFFDAMNSYYGSANTFGNTVLMNGCGSELISYLAGNYYTTNNFVRTLFTNNATEATAVWNYFYAPTPYPGASGAASFLQSNVSPVQDLYDQIGIQFSAIDVVTEFENTISTATLETALQGFGSLKTCTRTVLGDNDMFTILDLYDRTNLWDEMISNSTLSDLADMMITYEPGLFMQSAVELNTNRANDIFDNLPVTFHITDYLNAILNYVPFGSSYYTNIVNQLIGLGHAAGNWEYSAGEHHIYGSSRVGVHQTNLLTRARYNQGDICITLEDMEYTSLYRGKRHYELSNHLGNVQVVVSDKRISVCDSELEVDYFKAEVVSAMDYYPFGMMMPDRQWYANSDSSNYRFAFNGKEIDREHKGAGNIYDYGFRIYNPALGKFLSVDPLFQSYAWFTPYQYAGNSPIQYIDIDGLEGGKNTPYVRRNVRPVVRHDVIIKETHRLRAKVANEIEKENIRKAEAAGRVLPKFFEVNYSIPSSNTSPNPGNEPLEITRIKELIQLSDIQIFVRQSTTILENAGTEVKTTVVVALDPSSPAYKDFNKRQQQWEEGLKAASSNILRPEEKSMQNMSPEEKTAYTQQWTTYFNELESAEFQYRLSYGSSPQEQLNAFGLDYYNKNKDLIILEERVVTKVPVISKEN